MMENKVLGHDFVAIIKSFIGKLYYWNIYEAAGTKVTEYDGIQETTALFKAIKGSGYIHSYDATQRVIKIIKKHERINENNYWHFKADVFMSYEMFVQSLYLNVK